MKLDLARNALANLLGAAIPAVVALATVPLVVRGLGADGYGLFALITAIVGYFAIVDINVSAGSIRHIAAYRAQGDAAGVDETVSFGLLVYGGLGLAGALLLWTGADVAVRRLFDVPAPMAALAASAVRVAAWGFLAGQIQAYLDSVPHALLRYDSSARLDIVFGSAVPVLTVALLLAGLGLREVVLLRVVASTLHAVLLWRAVKRLLPDLTLRWPSRAVRRSLLRFSAFAFLSRFAALSYAYADKLLVGALVGVAGLAVYAVAATLANRLLGLTGRLAGVLFPAASALSASDELARLSDIYLRASRYLTFLNGAMLLLVAVFATPILTYWMSPAFARQGATVLAVMALSQFTDALTALPSLVNDGMNHPRVSGGFALARAVLGLATVYAGIRAAGIDGAAWGHLVASILLSAAFLYYVHGRTVPVTLPAVARAAYLPAGVGLVLIAVAAVALQNVAGPGPLALVAAAGATAMLLAGYGALVVARPGDRARVRALWRRKVHA